MNIECNVQYARFSLQSNKERRIHHHYLGFRSIDKEPMDAPEGIETGFYVREGARSMLVVQHAPGSSLRVSLPQRFLEPQVNP